MLGYSEGAKPFQHPGPVLCVNEGDTVTVILDNTLLTPSGPVSIVFPGPAGRAGRWRARSPQFDGGGA